MLVLPYLPVIHTYVSPLHIFILQETMIMPSLICLVASYSEDLGRDLACT